MWLVDQTCSTGMFASTSQKECIDPSLQRFTIGEPALAVYRCSSLRAPPQPKGIGAVLHYRSYTVIGAMMTWKRVACLVQGFPHWQGGSPIHAQPPGETLMLQPEAWPRGGLSDGTGCCGCSSSTSSISRRQFRLQKRKRNAGALCQAAKLDTQMESPAFALKCNGLCKPQSSVEACESE